MGAAGYEFLLDYKLTTVIYDLTVQFVKQYVSPFSRTTDQMVQAARSGRQNIAEGHMQGSLQGYIKLCGVARGSLEELLKDYQDYARQNSVPVWPKERTKTLRDIGAIWAILRVDSPYNPSSPYPLPKNKEVAVNLLLTLLYQAKYLLDKHYQSLEEKFIKEGGYTENLAQKRREYRGF